MIVFCTTTFFGTDDKTLDELIFKVANKDTSALEELYRLTKSGIYGFALSMLKSPSDAEDVLHDTYLSIWASAYMYASEGKSMAWLITIAKNHCFKVFRNRKWSEEELSENTADEALDFSLSADEKWVLEEYLTTLNDDERQIIMLHAVAGFKYREIADLLNMPLSTVLSKHHRGLKKLKENYKKEGTLDE
ncbi:MAG: sigma-70 family RNA polymerase sigma factor [Clostridia bacterium]|nr:sigma-70 family RNA polymerase sigma factor [Clostridia bacterium]